jgi:Zn-dependent protease with chaperone function
MTWISIRSGLSERGLGGIMQRILFWSLLVFLLTSCATSPEGRTQVMTPAPLQGVSAVYSELDMQLQLVIASDAPACQKSECAADRAFDLRILALGRRLADVAFRQNASLFLRLPRFEFIVADKADAGSASSGAGTVVIYRGVQWLDLDDAALAFILAREMSHVIGGHHEENVTTSILVSVTAQILFPFLNLARGAVAAVSSGAATTAASSAVSTTAMVSAASFAGSRALRASYRPQQVGEAEVMAMKLLAAAGWDGREVSEQLQSLRPALPDEPAWTEELRESARRIASLVQDQVLPESSGAVGEEGKIAPRFPADLPPPIVNKPF